MTMLPPHCSSISYCTIIYFETKGSFNRYITLGGGSGGGDSGFCYEALWKLWGGIWSDTVM